jgi:ABC-2 type transport system permease protein
MALTPGSFAWLVRHDFRMALRGLGHVLSAWSPVGRVAIVVFGIAMCHVVAWCVLVVMQSDPSAAPGPNTFATLSIVALLWMVSQGLLGATRAIYVRSDLDVLLASPLALWKVVFARAISIAMSSASSLALMILPLANVVAGQNFIRGQGVEALLAYPILAAFALAGTGLGLALSIVLLEALGARRARQVSNMIAALIAGGFVIGMQLAAVLPKDVLHFMGAWMPSMDQSTGGLTSRHLALPLSAVAGTAVSGDVVAMLPGLTTAVVVFVGFVSLLARRFRAAVLAAAGVSEASKTSRVEAQPPNFTQGLAASVRLKEWRLLTRDPNLFAQLGLQIVYTMPMAVILLRNPQELPPALALTPLIVVVAAQVAASLAWIAVSGEDAPELIATAPLPPGRANALKLSAIAAPVLAIVGLPLLGLAIHAPLAGLMAFAFATAAATSTAVLNLWHPMPANRRGLLRRHSQSKLMAMAEHGLALLWAVAVVMALMGSLAVLVPGLLITGVLWTLAPRTMSRPQRAWMPFAKASRAPKSSVMPQN